MSFYDEVLKGLAGIKDNIGGGSGLEGALELLFKEVFGETISTPEDYTVLARLKNLEVGLFDIESKMIISPATEEKQNDLKALIGEAEAVPSANTLLARIKSLEDKLDAIKITADDGGQTLVKATDLEALIGEADEEPDGYTLLARLKNIEDTLNNLNKNINNELIEKETLIWDGEELIKYLIIPVAQSDILIMIDNTCDKKITVTLEHEVEEDVFIPYKYGDGSDLSFDVDVDKKGVYGVFQKFPKYLGGRIVLTADIAPTINKTTMVQVQEV